MKKWLAVVVVLGVSAAVNAQQGMVAERVPDGWTLNTRAGDGDTIYLENTQSGYYAPLAENGLGGWGDDIHWDPNGPPGLAVWSVTGFSFAYFSQATFPEHQGLGINA